MADQIITSNQQPALGNKAVESTDRVEDLRRILEEEQDREISYGEANDVGESLLIFFQVLAEDSAGAT